MAAASWRMIGCDHPSFVQIGPLMRVITFPTFSNMAAVRHLELEFCHSWQPTKSAMRFDYAVKIWYRSDLRRRRYCVFMTLPVWLENAQPRRLFGGFSGGLNPLKLWVVIKTHKRHVLGWQRVIQAINGKNPSSSVSWVRLRWKKVYRTTSHKSVIFHIWVQVGC